MKKATTKLFYLCIFFLFATVQMQAQPVGNRHFPADGKWHSYKATGDEDLRVYLATTTGETIDQWNATSVSMKATNGVWAVTLCTKNGCKAYFVTTVIAAAFSKTGKYKKNLYPSCTGEYYF